MAFSWSLELFKLSCWRGIILFLGVVLHLLVLHLAIADDFLDVGDLWFWKLWSFLWILRNLTRLRFISKAIDNLWFCNFIWEIFIIIANITTWLVLIVAFDYLRWQALLLPKFGPFHDFHLAIHMWWHGGENVLWWGWISVLWWIVIDSWPQIGLLVGFIMVNCLEFSLIVTFLVRLKFTVFDCRV